LSKQFRERDVEKVYWAIVEGNVEPPSGRLVDYLRKDERHRRVHATARHAAGAQLAELDFQVLGHREGEPTTYEPSLALLEVRPRTGRKHQIRVQLSQAGYPILGDRKYGSKRPFPHGIALHARRLAVEHPVTKMQIMLEAPLPASWRSFVNNPK
jgi:23S rRNA pseudouridine1911/1915/1917 synthase